MSDLFLAGMQTTQPNNVFKMLSSYIAGSIRSNVAILRSPLLLPQLSICSALHRHHQTSTAWMHASDQTSQKELSIGDNKHLAYRFTPPAGTNAPCIVFLHGLCSNMTGTKATAIEQHAASRGYGCLLFDARGHGSSSCSFEGTHIGDWYKDAETALSQLTPPGQCVLVGSSLGGWLALQLALEHPREVAGLLLIAPALDFTERLWASLSAQQQQDAKLQGRIPVSSNYMEPVYASMGLVTHGERFLMLDKLPSLGLECPIRILHGVQDDAVPVDVARRLFDELNSDDMVLTLVKDGDHRLARPQDIRLMLGMLDGLVSSVSSR